MINKPHNFCPKTVIAVTGGKGGIGKTFVSVNLSVVLSQMGKRVVLMDGDFGLANIDVVLGMYPKYSLKDVFTGQCQLRDILIEGPCGIQVLPAGSGIEFLANLDKQACLGLIAAFNELATALDVLVIDTAAGISESVVRLTSASQQVFIVIQDDPASIADSYALIKLLSSKYGVNKFSVIVNMAKDSAHAGKLFAKLSNVSSQFLNIRIEMAGWLPKDDYVYLSSQQRRAVVDLYPGSMLANKFRQIAEKSVIQKRLTHDESRVSFFLDHFFGIQESWS